MTDPPPLPPSPAADRAARWLAAALVAVSALFLMPFAPWIVLALWTGTFARVIQAPFSRLLGDRPRLAAIATVVLVTLLIIPIALLLASLVVDAIDLVQQLSTSDRAHDLLERLVASEGNGGRTSTDLVDLLISQGDRAWAIAQQIAGATARVVIGLVILIAGTYAVLVDGKPWYAWVEDHAPVTPAVVRRLADAFLETGRGLFIGIGGTGLVQAVVATGAYLVLGVPQAFALGFLTLLCSIVPAVGTALVWGPIAIGLAVTGRPLAGLGLAVFGVLVIGTVDNLVRPYLARRGRLQLPTFVVLIAMFGGVELIGGWGLVLAPLAVRLAKEALAIVREARAQ